MKGYNANIEKLTLENTNFRQVLYTTQKSQLVLMSLKLKEEIGEEVHSVDQFLRCEAGKGKAVLDGVSEDLSEGMVVVVPAGSKHNVINVSETEDLKLYTLYCPPHHRDGIVHNTKAEAEADTEDHFDGKTTE